MVQCATGEREVEENSVVPMSSPWQKFDAECGDMNVCVCVCVCLHVQERLVCGAVTNERFCRGVRILS